MRPVRPELLLLGSIGSVQFGAAIANRLFPTAGPGGTVLLRLGLSALVLTAAVRPRLRGRTRADLVAVTAYGLVLGTMNWSFYEALARLPLGVAVTIEFVGPLGLAVLGSHRRLDLLWALLAAAGVGLLVLRDDRHGVTAYGVGLVLVAAACWAGYILLSKRVGQTFGQLDGLAIALCVGTIVVLPAGLVQGGATLLRPDVLATGAAVALLSSLLPYSLELVALRRLRAATFGLLMSLEPAVAALAGVLVLGQPVSGVLAVAVAMVVVASAGTTLTAGDGAAPVEPGSRASGGEAVAGRPAGEDPLLARLPP